VVCSVCLCLSVRPPVSLCVCLSVCLSLCRSVWARRWTVMWLFVSVHLSVCPSLSVSLDVHVYGISADQQDMHSHSVHVCLFVRLSVCLSVIMCMGDLHSTLHRLLNRHFVHSLSLFILLCSSVCLDDFHWAVKACTSQSLDSLVVHSVCLPVYLSLCVSVSVSVCLSVPVSIHLSVYSYHFLCLHV